ncbi:hypothetical protein DTO169E5_5185 [Paecilomyces variotii]|nr:hypothetical protein DTO169E5_5185 [Paecilomyces variotii]KAJ9295420.1 hypothetical protein DTO217A2_9028 [Paecilomyces variotii]
MQRIRSGIELTVRETARVVEAPIQSCYDRADLGKNNHVEPTNIPSLSRTGSILSSPRGICRVFAFCRHTAIDKRLFPATFRTTTASPRRD